MEQYRKTVITFGVLIVILFGLYYFTDWFSRTTGYVLGDNEKVNLAICLNTKDAVFYTSNNCPDCEKQIELFGEHASKFINVKVCDNVDECPSGGVPAWRIDNKDYYGVKELIELMVISECDVG